MRLYGFFHSKEEILDMMVDAVYAEIILGEGVLDDWREACKHFSARLREASVQHPWFPSLLGGRPHQGPNALKYLENSLAAMQRSGDFRSIDDVLLAVRTVNAYVLGFIQSEAAERRQESATGLTKEEWRDRTHPYLLKRLATGQFPTIERVVNDARHEVIDGGFEAGLSAVLMGIEQSFTHSAAADVKRK
ncbi:transcriptional regulator, TetR family [Ensifer sp. YR511]|nr:transcriptional regulator, TetR family [Ensifer sp. YR511]